MKFFEKLQEDVNLRERMEKFGKHFGILKNFKGTSVKFLTK